MEMRLRTPVTRGYFFLLGASRLVNAASLRRIDQKKISSGTQGKGIGNYSKELKTANCKLKNTSRKIGFSNKLLREPFFTLKILQLGKLLH